MGLIVNAMSPKALVGLFIALLIFVGLLYFLKERRRLVVVPYLRILREAMGDALFERVGGRWRRFYSFLFQGLLLLCAVLALADPEWDGQWSLSAGEEEKSAEPKLVLLLDRSRSMDMSRPEVDRCDYPSSIQPTGASLDSALCAMTEPATDRVSSFDVAKGRAAYLIHQSDPGTRVLLATLDTRVSVHSVWDDRQGALDSLASLDRTDLEDVPSLAETWLQSVRAHHTDARIHVVTDLQRSEQWLDKSARSWFLEGVGKPGRNLVLERFRVRADITRPGSAIARCSVSYSNATGSTEPVAFMLELRASNLSTPEEEEVVGVERRIISQGESVDIVFDLAGLPGGVLEARVLVDDAAIDSIPADSRRWAAVPALRPVRVGAVGQIPSYLLAALVADPFVEFLEPLDSAERFPSDTEIQLFVGQVPEQLSRPTLIFDPPVMTHPLAAALEIESGQARASKHPFWKQFKPGDIIFDRSGVLIPATGEQVLMHSGNAVVATIGRQYGHPVVRIGLDPRESQVALSPFFPALVARAVDYLQTRLDLVGREYDAGHISLDPEIFSELSRLYSSSGDMVSFSQTAGNKSAWLGSAGLYIAHDKAHHLEPVIVGGTRDEVEGRARGATLLSGSREKRLTRAFSRSGSWYFVLAVLGIGLVLEHLLFVRRRIW